jgi:hypothetical protein
VGDWMLLFNPYASNLDLIQTIKDLGKIVQGFTASILTYGNGGYSYKTIDDEGKGTFGSSAMNKTSIPPFQAFWIQNGFASTSKTISAGLAQVDNSQGSDLSKRNDKYHPLEVGMLLKNNNGDVQEFIELLFVNDINYKAEDYNAINMNGLADMATMYIPNSNGNRIYEGHDISVLNTDFTSELEMIGKIAGTYTISMSGMTIDPSYNVYIVDKQEGVTHLLNQSAYSFTHNPANDAARFEVRITTETLGESEKIEASSIKLANKGNSIEFIMPSTSGIESVQFVSLSGQVVKTVQAYKGQTEFDVAEFKSGVYIAQLKLESGNVASYKFVK